MKIKQSKQVLIADFPKSKVLFNLITYYPYILNHSAAEIWDFCKTPKSIDKIAELLAKNYKINISKAKRDTKKLIKDLKRKGLICVTDHRAGCLVIVPITNYQLPITMI